MSEINSNGDATIGEIVLLPDNTARLPNGMIVPLSQDITPSKSIVTRRGLNLVKKWAAGIPRVFDDIWVGNGRFDDDPTPQQLSELTALLSPVARATQTEPFVEYDQLSFTVEYRNNFDTDPQNPDNLGGPLPNGFWLNEVGVFFIDPDLGRILAWYGTLGNFPTWMFRYTAGIMQVKRMPVAIGSSNDGEIVLRYPSNAFMTSQNVANYVRHAAGRGLIDLSAAAVPPDGTRLQFHSLLEIPNFPINIATIAGGG